MKTPSLLLLLAAAFVATSAAAADPEPRCKDAAWLASARDAAVGTAPADPNKYLTVDAAKLPVIDIAKSPALCDATVWRYLVHFSGTVGAPAAVLVWNDPQMGAAWDKGLKAQAQILLAVNELYQRTDVLGRDALAKADVVAKAAVTSGVAKQDAGTDLKALKEKGLTAKEFAGDTDYKITAIAAPAADAPLVAVKDLTDAFGQLVQDVPEKPAAAVKKTAKPAKPAAVAKPAKKEVKLGAGVLAFRRAVIALANELSVRASHRDLMKKAGVEDPLVKSDFVPNPAAAGSAKAALAGPDGNASIPAGKESSDAAYAAALTFITDGKIAAGGDAGPYDSAALSGLDVGLRNLIAVRAAAVDQSVAAAKARLGDGSVGALLAAAGHDPRLPANQSSANMADAVLRHLQGTKDYSDLSKLYDANAAKDKDFDATPAAVALKAQMKSMRDDAAATTVVPGADGPALQYSTNKTKVTDAGISVADLDRSQAYRETIAEAVAQNIATNPPSAEFQAIVASLMGKGAKGTDVIPPVKVLPGTVEQLPDAKPVAVTATDPHYFDHGGCAFLVFGCKSGAEKVVADSNKQLSKEADQQIQARSKYEKAANDAADLEVQARADGLAAIQSNPDPEIDKKAATDAYNAETNKRASAASAAFLANHKGDYVSAEDGDKIIAAKRKATNDKLDAAYSATIAASVKSLNDLYKASDSDQRSYAERKSGYKGQWYDKYAINPPNPPIDGQPYGRVDLYFTQSWKGAAAVDKCKAALGFKADGDSSKFKDPNTENVDKVCGVRDGLVALLVSFKGKQQPAKPVDTAAAAVVIAPVK